MAVKTGLVADMASLRMLALRLNCVPNSGRGRKLMAADNAPALAIDAVTEALIRERRRDEVGRQREDE